MQKQGPRHPRKSCRWIRQDCRFSLRDGHLRSAWPGGSARSGAGGGRLSPVAREVEATAPGRDRLTDQTGGGPAVGARAPAAAPGLARGSRSRRRPTRWPCVTTCAPAAAFRVPRQGPEACAERYRRRLCGARTRELYAFSRRVSATASKAMARPVRLEELRRSFVREARGGGPEASPALRKPLCGDQSLPASLPASAAPKAPTSVPAPSPPKPAPVGASSRASSAVKRSFPPKNSPATSERYS